MGGASHFVELTAPIPHLGSFHLRGFETPKQGRREVCEAVDFNGLHRDVPLNVFDFS